MAYCRYCGSEMDDRAVLCTKCGIMVDGKGPKIGKVAENVNSPATVWTAYAGLISFCVALLCVIYSLNFDINWVFYQSIGSNNTYYSNVADNLFYSGLAFATVSFGLGISTFIIAMIDRVKKNLSFSTLFFSITVFSVSTILFAFVMGTIGA